MLIGNSITLLNTLRQKHDPPLSKEAVLNILKDSFLIRQEKSKERKSSDWQFTEIPSLISNAEVDLVISFN